MLNLANYHLRDLTCNIEEKYLLNLWRMKRFKYPFRALEAIYSAARTNIQLATAHAGQVLPPAGRSASSTSKSSFLHSAHESSSTLKSCDLRSVRCERQLWGGEMALFRVTASRLAETNQVHDHLLLFAIHQVVCYSQLTLNVWKKLSSMLALSLIMTYPQELNVSHRNPLSSELF